MLVGRRLELTDFKAEERLATHPLSVAVSGGGVAVLFRYGVVVLFGVEQSNELAFLKRLGSRVVGMTPADETEKVTVVIDAGKHEDMTGNQIELQSPTIEKLQLVAEVLSRSVVLGEYESLVGETFDEIEPLALSLQNKGRVSQRARRLLKYIGKSMLSQHRMIGRAEINDKPELLWEKPELEPLYVRLEEELEIGDRYAVINRKLDLISKTASTSLELLHNRLSHRLEWFIIILIAVEIGLFVYDLWIK